MILLLPILIALFHRLRGWSPKDNARHEIALQRHWSFDAVPDSDLPKWTLWADKATSKVPMVLCVIASLFGLISWEAACAFSIAYTLFIFAGGWGDYFDYTDAPNKEIGWIDSLLEKMPNGKRKDIIAMSLRSWPFLIFAVPMGYIFYIGKKLSHAVAELFIGLYIGGCALLVDWLIA